MPIYDKPVHALMKDFVAHIGLKAGQQITKDEVVSWFKEKYPKIADGTISAHLLMLSTNAHSRIHYGVSLKGDDDLFYQIDSKHFRLYDPKTDPQPIYPGSPKSTTDENEQNGETPEVSEFAYEKDLQHFLAKNLSLLEPGLKIYENEGLKGLEFPAGGRFIDILAVDSHNGFVVIELKVSKGYDRVVGQLLRYMAWIEKHLAASDQTTRGVIVAREISEDLSLAVSKVSGVELWEYSLAVALKKVQ